MQYLTVLNYEQAQYWFVQVIHCLLFGAINYMNNTDYCQLGLWQPNFVKFPSKYLCFEKIHLKMPSAQCHPFCSRLYVSNICLPQNMFEGSPIAREFSSIPDALELPLKVVISYLCVWPLTKPGVRISFPAKYAFTNHDPLPAYGDIGVMVSKLHATQLFVQQLVQIDTIDPHHWPVLRGIRRWSVDSHHKVPVVRKSHDMAFSHSKQMVRYERVTFIKVISWS